MSNLLNTVMVSKGNNETAPSAERVGIVVPKQKKSKQYMMPLAIDTAGKSKPFKDDAKLLPSRIFDSPIGLIKDTKDDFVSLGKALSGKADDYEMGRANSLALKIGSAGIGTYLLAKSPVKMDKTMQVAGFASFFGAMTLWPKLAIQLPIKLRTGVDVQQEYVDSQGRKKYLYQDPQYVLTDLLPSQELNKIGKKLDVNENLPDRDSFIKERAHKIATQANTLWMMSAGIVPVMSALMCNAIEKSAAKPIVEAFELKTNTLNDDLHKDYSAFNQNSKLHKEFVNFLEDENVKSQKLDKELLKEICNHFDKIDDKKYGISGEIKKYIEQISDMGKIADEKANLSATPKELVKHVLNNSFGEEDGEKIAKILSKNAPEDIWASLKTNIEKNNVEDFSTTLSNVLINHDEELWVKVQDLDKEFNIETADNIKHTVETANTKTVGDIAGKLKKMHIAMLNLDERIKIIDKFKNARIGNTADSYSAHHWGKVGDTLVKALDTDNIFSVNDLGNMSKDDNVKFVREQFEKLAKSPVKSQKAMEKLLKLAEDYEVNIQDGLFDKISSCNEKVKSNNVIQAFALSRDEFKELGCDNIADNLASEFKDGPNTLAKQYADEVKLKVLSDKASFYRQILALSLFMDDATQAPHRDYSLLDKRIRNILEDYNLDRNQAKIDNIKNLCKDIVLRADNMDFGQQFKERNINIERDLDYKIAMRTIFNIDKNGNVEYELFDKTEKRKDKHFNTISKLLNRDDARYSPQEREKYLKNVRNFSQEFIETVLNWKNPVTNEQGERVISTKIRSASESLRNSITGTPISSFIKEAAKTESNTKKWKMLFGGVMAAATAATVGAGLMFGRKGSVEKQAEEESRKNDKLYQ